MDLVTLSMAKASESTINKKLEKKLEEYTKEQLKAVAANVDGYAEEFDNEIEEAKNNCDKDIDEASTDVDSYLNEALLDISSEYYELSNDVDLGLRDKADKIEVVLEGDIISVQDSSDRELGVLKLYGKTTQDGTPTPDAPIEFESVGDKGSVETVVCGKNLFGGDALANAMIAQGNVTHNAEDKTLEYIGAENRNKFYFDNFKPNTQYTFILYGRNIGGTVATSNLAIQYTDGMVITLKFSTMSENSYCVWTSMANKTVKVLKSVYESGSSLLYYEKCGIFEGVLPQEAFEPYKGQSLTVATPNSLRGVPALSDSEYINYIDSTGKKWICDEIDFERGVYIQRVYEDTVDIYTVNSTSTMNYGVWNTGSGSTNKILLGNIGILSTAATPVLSNSSRPIGTVWENGGNIVFAGSTEDTLETMKEKYNGTKVLYVLKEPIETPLTQEQLEAFKSLHSYYPISNIFCNENAGLKISYIADTKNHIDTAFNSIKQIVLNN